MQAADFVDKQDLWSFCQALGGAHHMTRGLDIVSAYATALGVTIEEFVQMTCSLPGELDPSVEKYLSDDMKRQICGVKVADTKQAETVSRSTSILESNVVIQAKNAAKTEVQDHEIFALERKRAGYKLKASARLLKFEDALKEPVPVVSFLGNTTSGKSFLLSHLIAGVDDMSDNEEGLVSGSGEAKDAKPYFLDEGEEDRGAYASTTSNANLFATTKILPGRRKLNFVDFEGNNGTLPAMSLAICAEADAAGGEETKDASGKKKKEKLPGDLKRAFHDEAEFTRESRRRRQAVADYFPKLAYLVSDVVVMLTTETFVCSACYDQVMEMVVAANQGVSDIVRPSLILVHNQAKLTETFDVGETTTRFLQSHDADGELSNYFVEVRCINIPRKYDMFRKKGKVVDGRVVFREQIGRLRDSMSELIQIQEDNKAQLNATVSEEGWFQLVHVLVKMLAKNIPVSLATIVQSCISVNDLDKSVLDAAFSTNFSHHRSKENFEICCAFALQLFGRHVAMKLKGESYLSAQMIDQSIKDHLATATEYLRDREPCQSRYTGDSVPAEGEPNQEILCLQAKHIHRNLHATSIKVVPAGKGWWQRIVRSVKKLTRLGLNEVWKGAFEFDEAVFYDVCSFDHFRDDAVDLITKNQTDYLMSLRDFSKTNKTMLSKLYFRRCLSCFCELAAGADVMMHQGVYSQISWGSSEQDDESILAFFFLCPTCRVKMKQAMSTAEGLSPTLPAEEDSETKSQSSSTMSGKKPEASSPRVKRSNTLKGEGGKEFQSTCVICQDNFVEVMFHPCGHVNACESCARMYNTCPMNCPTDSYVTIFANDTQRSAEPITSAAKGGLQRQAAAAGEDDDDAGGRGGGRRR